MLHSTISMSDPGVTMLYVRMRERRPDENRYDVVVALRYNIARPDMWLLLSECFA